MTAEERLENAERQLARMMARYRLLLATVVAMGLVMIGTVAISMGAGRRERVADGPASLVAAAGPRDTFDELRDAAGDRGGERPGKEGVTDLETRLRQLEWAQKVHAEAINRLYRDPPTEAGEKRPKDLGRWPGAEGVESLKTRLSQLESEQHRNEREVRDLREGLRRIEASVPGLASQLEREQSGNEKEMRDLQDGLRRIEMRMLTLESRSRSAS
jgi:hypothetical protein